MFWNSLGERAIKALHNDEDGVLKQMEKIVKEIHVCARESPCMVLLVLFIKSFLIHSSI